MHCCVVGHIAVIIANLVGRPTACHPNCLMPTPLPRSRIQPMANPRPRWEGNGGRVALCQGLHLMPAPLPEPKPANLANYCRNMASHHKAPRLQSFLFQTRPPNHGQHPHLPHPAFSVQIPLSKIKPTKRGGCARFPTVLFLLTFFFSPKSVIIHSSTRPNFFPGAWLKFRYLLPPRLFPLLCNLRR